MSKKRQKEVLEQKEEVIEQKEEVIEEQQEVLEEEKKEVIAVRNKDIKRIKIIINRNVGRVNIGGREKHTPILDPISVTLEQAAQLCEDVNNVYIVTENGAKTLLTKETIEKINKQTQK